MIDTATLRKLLDDIDGIRAVIDMDMHGVDPGVGKVIPLPIDHTQLRDMVLLLLGPCHTNLEYEELLRRFIALQNDYNLLAAKRYDYLLHKLESLAERVAHFTP